MLESMLVAVSELRPDLPSSPVQVAPVCEVEVVPAQPGWCQRVASSSGYQHCQQAGYLGSGATCLWCSYISLHRKKVDVRTEEQSLLLPKVVVESGLLGNGVEEAVDLLKSCFSQHPGAGSCREPVGVEPAMVAHAFYL